MRKHLRTAVLFGVFLTGNGLADSPTQAGTKPAKIFTDQRLREARVEAPWRNIQRRKLSDDRWQGLFRYEDEQGQEVSIPVEISTRGVTRKRVCDFPPLRLKFDKQAAKGTAFRGAGRLKLVTHCLDNRKYEQYPIKEYLAYRIYNQLTDMSFRVQPLQLSYAQDSESKALVRFAFLIEDIDDVADRNGLAKLGLKEITPARLEPLPASRFMLFQYLISNLDWSVLSSPEGNCCHNARLIGASDTAAFVVPVPYDFDSSGLVNAKYAAPPGGLKVRNVRQRLYRGFCQHAGGLQQAMAEFKAQQEAINGLIEEEPLLDESQRRYTQRLMDDFYEELGSEAGLNALNDSCRG